MKKKTQKERDAAEAFALQKFRELIDGLEALGYRVDYLTAHVVGGSHLSINNEFWKADKDQPIDTHAES